MKVYFIILLLPLLAFSSGLYDQKEVRLEVFESNHVQMVTARWENGFTNCFDIYWSTNQADWMVAGYNICPLDFEINIVEWKIFPNVDTGYFAVQNIQIDNDQDGIPDCREVHLFKTNPAKADTDGDSIPDLHELKQRTDPVNKQDDWDTDLDGIPDAVEKDDIILPVEQRQYTYKQAKQMAAVRGGQLVNISDYASIDEFKTSLLFEPSNKEGNFWVKCESDRYAMIRWDTMTPLDDQFGKAAFILKISGLNPNSWDTDDDGISDSGELFIHESNPFQKDTDRDGISDYEEVRRGLDPVDARNRPVRYGPSSYCPNPYYEEEKDVLFKKQVKENATALDIKPPEHRPEIAYDDKFSRTQILRTPNIFQKITYTVVDIDSGVPVTNAVMKVWRGDDIPVTSEGTLEYKNKNPETGSELKRTFSAPEYYKTEVSYVFERADWVTGKQLPWNPTREVSLRKIKDPVEMVSFIAPNGMKIPATNAPVEFDVVAGDWLPPYGRGEICDVIFFASNNVPQDPLVRNTLSFPNPSDGIQEYRPDEKQKQSEFIFPYLAPLDGYQSKLEKSETTGVNPRTHNFVKDVNYIFRIRSRKESNGDVSALYGRVNGELTMGAHGIKFEYLLNTNETSRSLEHKEKRYKHGFNPVPNERSLEYSGVNLLKK
jgi:hypothetical protein